MKISILTTSFPRFKGDNSGQFIYRFAKRVARKGHEVSVLTQIDYLRKTKPKENIDNIKVNRFTYFYPRSIQILENKEDDPIPDILKKNILAWLQLPFLLLFYLLNAIKVTKTSDVIHANWELSGLIAVICKKINKTPVVITLRGEEFTNSNNFFIKKIRDYVYENADRIVLISHGLEKKVLNLGVPKSKLRIVRNGINIDKFNTMNKKEVREQLNLPINKTIITHIGAIITRKGLDYLVDAMPKIMKKHKDVVLVFVGKGFLEDHLKEKIKKLKIQDKVIFAGFKPYTEIPLWANAADLFILSSLEDTGPNTVFETMCCEVPVISTKVGIAPELIDNGKTGFFIRKKNIRDIEDCTLKLLDNKNLLKKMGKAARQSIIDKGLTWEKCADNYIEVYKEAMGK